DGVVEPPDEPPQLELISVGPSGQEVADPRPAGALLGTHLSLTSGRQLDEVDAAVLGVAMSGHEPSSFHRPNLTRDGGGVEPEPGRESFEAERPRRVERSSEEVARPVEIPMDVRTPAEA